MKHCNIPIFIPHLGCPHQCVFCNQHSISGCGEFREETVPEQIEKALQTIPADAETEIAFFGGTFTGIDRGLMIRLLEVAQGYIRQGKAQSIRLSTRPDDITEEILEILSRYSVKTVELGLQSLSDEVLKASGRGHDAKTARIACHMVKDAGFSLVGQMMIGLPASSLQEEIQTAEDIADLGAEAVRIYPTVVFAQTPLEKMMREGIYQPLSLKEAVERTAKVYRIFRDRGIKLLRIGLCESEELHTSSVALAGAIHPALGELVLNAVAYEDMAEKLQAEQLLGKNVILKVPSKQVSVYVGQHRENIIQLEKMTDTRIVRVLGEDRETVSFTECTETEREIGKNDRKRRKQQCI